MKLYTEEQVRKGLTTKNNILPVDLFLEQMTPIELPSEEEIDKNAKDSWINYEYEEGNLYHTTYNGGFKNGTKWVIEQIKQ